MDTVENSCVWKQKSSRSWVYNGASYKARVPLINSTIDNANINRYYKMTVWTIRKILKWTTDYFDSKGVNTPRLDAEVLLAHALKKDRLYLYMNMDRPLSAPERASFRQMVTQRANRAPCALITESKEFWSMEFKVTPGTLIPRPETETLVERAIKLLKGKLSPSILELGVGSGAISVSLASEIPEASVIAVDISYKALKCAAINIKRFHLDDRIRLVCGDLFDPIARGSGFDLIVSNPPYIPTTDIGGLEREIKDNEPLEALDGGHDGLDIIRRICLHAYEHLKPGGGLAIEIGDSQEDEVKSILESTGFYGNISSCKDLAGIARVISGTTR